MKKNNEVVDYYEGFVQCKECGAYHYKEFDCEYCSANKESVYEIEESYYETIDQIRDKLIATKLK